MSNFIKKNKIGLLLMVVGILSLSFGIFRQEHLTVAKKSNIICLECIGIG
ncbi:CD1871A family CXXC motif-containing protein [Intestinibacter sp.]